jgi:hypothetical protein
MVNLYFRYLYLCFIYIMDKHRYARGPDTGIIEIKRLLECLLSNNYKFEGTSEANRGIYDYPNDAIADFTKRLDFADTDGNAINDGYINVSIQFEKRADYNNFKKDEYKDNIYVGDTEEFISELIEETQKKLRKKRRTRKRISVNKAKRAASI